MQKFAAIPTEYNDVQFRSRLEARWARAFDLFGWKWEYEPIDLDGWIPDFILIGKSHRTLVEVKPFAIYDEFLETIKKIDKAQKKSKNKQEVLLLGYTPGHESKSSFQSNNCIGWLKENEQFWDQGWDNAVFQTFKIGEEYFSDFSHDSGNWTGRIHGHHITHEKCCKFKGVNFTNAFIEVVWKESGNMVQWKKPSNNL